MDKEFEIIDKTGRKIRFTKKQGSHMMKRHPYMQKYIKEIKGTLKVPDKIKKYKGKGYYFKYYKYLKDPNQFILVIVKYLNGKGFVITSYLEKRIK